MDDPRPIEGKPNITIEFDSVNSAIANISITKCGYMQVFAAAKMLEMQGEGMFMQEQIRNAQKKGGIVVPQMMPGQKQ